MHMFEEATDGLSITAQALLDQIDDYDRYSIFSGALTPVDLREIAIECQNQGALES